MDFSDGIDEVIEIIESNNDWIDIYSSDTNCYSKNEYKNTKYFIIRSKIIMNIRSEQLFELISDPMNQSLYDSSVNYSRNEGNNEYCIDLSLPVQFCLPKVFKLTNMITDTMQISIRYYLSNGILKRTIFAVKKRNEGSEFIIIEEFKEKTVEEKTIPFLNTILMKKQNDNINEYFNRNIDSKRIYEMERNLFNTMTQKEKEYKIIYHENKKVRVKINIECTQFYVQGEVISKSRIIDIMTQFAHPENWDFIFPITVLIKNNDRIRTYHRETLFFGDKVTIDQSISYRIGDSFGIISFQTEPKLCQYEHFNQCNITGGAFITSISNIQRIQYGYLFTLQCLNNISINERKKIIYNLTVMNLAIHAFFSQPCLNLLFIQNKLLNRNEMANQLLANVYMFSKIKDKETTVSSIISHAPILFCSNKTVLKVFWFLGPRDLFVLPFVCRKFRAALTSEVSNQIYKKIYEQYINKHTFDKRYPNKELTSHLYRSEFLYFCKRDRNCGKTRGKLFSLQQPIDNVIVMNNGIIASNGKKLMKIDFNGKMSRMQSYGNIVSMKRGVDEDTLYVYYKTGGIRKYVNFEETTKMTKIGEEHGKIQFGFNGSTIFHIGNEIIQYECQTGNELWRSDIQNNISCVYDNENIIIIGKENGRIEILDKRENKTCFNFVSHIGGVIDIQGFDNHFISVGNDNIIRMWDMRINEREYDRRPHTGQIKGFELFNRKIISYSSEKDVVQTWIVNNQMKLPQTLFKTENKIKGFSCNDRYIIISQPYGNLLIHDFEQ
ncbi:F-box domain containing protein [Entamoeba histolytica HM-1:IMSS-B]|uniref:F-box domain containing protein n=5 Tax=Entamoeba histolytica TaxID=5759 RepID=C4LUI0_ENTH1|nr:F-box domain containing protein [Entamoeba histolytica HM-1:IMSS]EMD45092.1 F-box domain containing protein [Entamoeba histolytica KU27]EMH77576.1 F-box domain containing protein [Entamoeba histolytica HM-1:IMSS-B]ENY65954.1 F-box domain containing protein [Entamoeba histolytica HM-1:IMSS-A]GAT92268.1 f-box domain containing protein [Entamoeba histolytica]EAL51795.1 F-box domain containing protein [Entamoeba histolytica HM-1:IMSS]|eukprot:XP_657181.1 F-box domain containing protein [Entamoeba histolytica HM-1:IMSS]